MYLSIISPVYQAENILNELIEKILSEVTQITEDFEIIFIDDGSLDNSWNKIQNACCANMKIKGIKLSRNFGQHYAITAGLRESRGEFVVVMDCDLQDNPKYISQLIKKVNEGYDVVLTTHEVRKHSLVKNIFSRLFYKVFNTLVSNEGMKNGGKYSALSILSRKVVDSFCDFNDYHRQYIPIIKWLGFSTTEMEVEHDIRFEGKSSYSFFSLLKLALDGIISHSERLLKISIYTGFIFAFIGFTSIIYIVIQYFNYGFQSGWASLIVSIIFSTGLILISLGIVGIYLGKTFEQTKSRPLYIIDKKVNMD